jgi:hypothetical protein
MRTKCITLYYEITCKFKKQIREIKIKKLLGAMAKG